MKNQKLKKMHRLNIVVVGKAGVGKSSLLNYLVDKEIFETGAGAPVTQKYFDEHTYTDPKTSVTYNLFDTKGIEPDTLEEFSSNINQQITDRGKSADFSSHFHALYYCISAAGKRIEPFETDFIKRISSLIDVVIVLTKCDLVSKQDIDALHDQLRNTIGASSTDVESPIRISDVCNVKKITRRGISEAFGKKEILDHSFVGMWNTFTRSKGTEINNFFEFFVSTWSRKQFYVEQKIEEIEVEHLILLPELDVLGLTPTITYEAWTKFKNGWLKQDSEIFTEKNLNNFPFFLIFKLPHFNVLNISLSKKDGRILLLHWLSSIRQLIINLQNSTFFINYETNFRSQINEVLEFYRIIVGQKLEEVPMVKSKQKLSEIRKLVETEIRTDLLDELEKLILIIYNYEKFGFWQSLSIDKKIDELFIKVNNLLIEKGKLLNQLCASFIEITNTELHQYGKLMLNKHGVGYDNFLNRNEKKYIEDFLFYYMDGNNINEIKRYFLERKRIILELSSERVDELEKIELLKIINN